MSVKVIHKAKQKCMGVKFSIDGEGDIRNRIYKIKKAIEKNEDAGGETKETPTIWTTQS